MAAYHFFDHVRTRVNWFLNPQPGEAYQVEKSMETLQKAGKIYEKDGAVWFKSSDYEDDQDRVLVKTDGKNTYLTADIAYHKNKLDRGFERLLFIKSVREMKCR